MVNDKMGNVMKRHYTIPTSQVQRIYNLGAICVGSIHGSEGIKYGGGSDGSDDKKKPF